MSATTARIAAQGVTTAAIVGRVRAVNGADVDSTLIRVKNEATGIVSQGRVRNGLYRIQGLETGGPYAIAVQRRHGLLLHARRSSAAAGQLRGPGERGARLEVCAVFADFNAPHRQFERPGQAVSLRCGVHRDAVDALAARIREMIAS